MKTFIKLVAVLVIFVPYRLSEYGKDSSFMQDFLVAAAAFGVGYLVIYLVSPKNPEGK